MESIGWCDYKIQCSCKACVFQAGLDIGRDPNTDIRTCVSLSLFCLLLFNFFPQTFSLHVTDKMATSSSKLTSFKTSNHRAHRTSLYQCLFINSRQGCDHLFLNHMPKSEPSILAGREGYSSHPGS